MPERRWSVPADFGPVAVVGGGSGIGRALAVRLSTVGVDTYVLGRRADALAETVALAPPDGGRLEAIACDGRDPEDVERAFSAIESASGPARGLAQCAIEMNYVPARDLTFETFRAAVAATLDLTFNVVHRWSSALLGSRRGGSAVLLTSCMAANGTPGIAHSSAGKSGMESFAKSVAREWAADGLRVNVVGPGFFPTPKSAEFWERPASRPVRDLVAMGRLGRLEEVVEPIVFLLSGAASYVTGQVLSVDGGFSLTPYGHWHYREMEIFVEHLGLTPLQAISCGTRNGAVALGQEGEPGTIEPERRADVLVIAGDPTRDVAALGDKRRFRHLYVRGRAVDLDRPWPERTPLPGERVSAWSAVPLTWELVHP